MAAFAHPQVFLDKLAGSLENEFENHTVKIIAVFFLIVLPAYIFGAVKLCCCPAHGFPSLQKFAFVWVALSLIPRFGPSYNLNTWDSAPVIQADVPRHPGVVLQMTPSAFCLIGEKTDKFEPFCEEHFGSGFLWCGNILGTIATFFLVLMIFMRDVLTDPEMPFWYRCTRKQHCCTMTTPELREVWTAIPQIVSAFLYSTSFASFVCLRLYLGVAWDVFPSEEKVWNYSSGAIVGVYATCALLCSIFALVAFSTTGKKYDPTKRSIV